MFLVAKSPFSLLKMLMVCFFSDTVAILLVSSFGLCLRKNVYLRSKTCLNFLQIPAKGTT